MDITTSKVHKLEGYAEVLYGLFNDLKTFYGFLSDSSGQFPIDNNVLFEW